MSRIFHTKQLQLSEICRYYQFLHFQTIFNIDYSIAGLHLKFPLSFVALFGKEGQSTASCQFAPANFHTNKFDSLSTNAIKRLLHEECEEPSRAACSPDLSIMACAIRLNLPALIHHNLKQSPYTIFWPLHSVGIHLI